MSTGRDVNSGKTFERTVAGFFRAAGYQVSPETLVDYKNIDLLVKYRVWGEGRTAAVECKDYSRPLGKGQLERIWASYRSLYENGTIDELLVVSSHGFSPAARAFSNATRGLLAKDFRELLSEIVDFGPYLQNVIDEHHTAPDGLHLYYQAPLTVGGHPAEGLVYDWIAGVDGHGHLDPTKPLAILGAYGIGKSSFALSLSARLAGEALNDPQARIPVLLSLADLGAEQKLSGLLGRYFTEYHAIPGYTYHTFLQLNRNGRFVVFLDGFDEIRQLMSRQEFRHAIREFGRLHDGDSRLVILGRPTAFESDEEQDQILHGGRSAANSSAASELPDFVVVELGGFEPEQVREFLRKYIALLHAQSRVREDLSSDSVWEQVRSRHLRDLARRPIQLRMLAEILPEYLGDIEELTLDVVFSLFIDHIIGGIIQREEDKRARLAFTAGERRTFLRRLAYWLWTEGGAHGVVAVEDIPLPLIQSLAPPDKAPEVVRRDLVAGAPLDRKFGESIRFPHRSIQEFLVGEECWRLLRTGDVELSHVDTLMTDELAHFMREQMMPDDATSIKRNLLRARGLLHWRTVRALCLNEHVFRQLMQQTATESKRGIDSTSPWSILVATLYTKQALSRRDSARPDEVVHLLDTCRKAEVDDGLLTLQAALCIALLISDHDTAALRGSLIDSLSSLISRRGRLERVTAEELRDTPFLCPLEGGKVILNLRRSGPRLGWNLNDATLARRGSRGMQYDLKSPHIRVRWLPDFSLDLARRLEFTRNDSAVVLKGAKVVFGASLTKYAYVTDWLDDPDYSRRGYSGSRVDMVDMVSASRDVVSALRLECLLVRASYTEAKKLMAGSPFQRLTSPW
jgi:hypothetical protein